MSPLIPDANTECKNTERCNVGRKVARVMESVNKLMYTSFANHYDSDRLGSLCAVVQNESSFLKILQVHD
jgi:hypothetical protein